MHLGISQKIIPQKGDVLQPLMVAVVLAATAFPMMNKNRLPHKKSGLRRGEIQ